MTEFEVALILRLLKNGTCKEAARTVRIIERFRRARWIEVTGRAGEWRLIEGGRSKIEVRLRQLLPTWAEDVDLLKAHSLDEMDPANIRSLAALRGKPSVSGFVHRKVWNAATTSGSKIPSRLTSHAALTDDWSQRGRASCRTMMLTAHGQIDLLAQTLLATEFAIPERCWRSAQGFEGDLPELIMTVENVGPFVDLELPEAALLLFSQGAAVEGAAAFLRAFPSARWLHFCDLDHAGLQIGERLARIAGRPLSLYIPSFAEEYLPRAIAAKKPWATPKGKLLPVLQQLVSRNSWLEQECFVLDSRLASDIAAAAAIR